MAAEKDAALQGLIEQVLAARAAKSKLDIRGGGTKVWYGEAPHGEPLDTRPLAGISSYEPTELVVTARAGTPLAVLEATLAEKGQCLPFEPPRFSPDGTAGATPGGTVGGMVAAGLAGPARATVGGVRDYVLGATLLNGRGELLSFGGQVMKNVAGYDVSRLLAGSLGVLGVICEVSLKVLPKAPATRGQPLPLSASAWWEGTLVLRLAGAAAAVDAAQARLGGESVEPPMAAAFWAGLRDHADEFFTGAARAVQRGAGWWRLSLPQTAPPLKLSGEQLVEWGGAQRWLCTSAPASQLRDIAQAAGGHATLVRGADKSAGAFAPLKAPLDRIHRQMKAAFDPDGVFNPGRLYPGL